MAFGKCISLVLVNSFDDMGEAADDDKERADEDSVLENVS
jgi:hypothetical protein